MNLILIKVDLSELNLKVNELLHVSKLEITCNFDHGNKIFVVQNLVDRPLLSI
jgi:hypothetical protein